MEMNWKKKTNERNNFTTVLLLYKMMMTIVWSTTFIEWHSVFYQVVQYLYSYFRSTGT